MAAAAKTVASAARNRWGNEDQRIIEGCDKKNLALDGSVR
jgi:hypothetical protein